MGKITAKVCEGGQAAADAVLSVANEWPASRKESEDVGISTGYPEDVASWRTNMVMITGHAAATYHTQMHSLSVGTADRSPDGQISTADAGDCGECRGGRDRYLQPV